VTKTDLHTGAIDKYLYLMRLCASMVMGFLGSLILVGTGVLMSTLPPTVPNRALNLLLGVLSGGMITWYVTTTELFRRLMDSLNNFDEFDRRSKRLDHGTR
jgi:hypothetical protein